MRKFNIGPCRILVADAIDDPYGDWLDLGFTRGETTVEINSGNFAMGRADQVGITPLADAVHLTGQFGQVTFNLVSREIERLMKIMPHSVNEIDGALSALGFGSKLGMVTPVAVALIPEFDFDENDVRKLWKSPYSHWFSKAYFNLTGAISNQLPEGDDSLEAHSIEIMMRQVVDADSVNGGIGSIFILPNGIPVMGSGNPAQLSVAVPDADLQSFLVGESLDSVQAMTQNTTALSAGAGTIADATGIEFLIKTASIDLSNNPVATLPSLKHFTHLTNLDLADCALSEETASELIDELWKIRTELGDNSAVIAVENNNGLSQKAQDQIQGTAGTRYAGDGLVQAGATVTF